MKTFAFYIGLFAMLALGTTNAYALANCGSDPAVARPHIPDVHNSQNTICTCSDTGAPVPPSQTSICRSLGPPPNCLRGHNNGAQSDDKNYLAGWTYGIDPQVYYGSCVCDVNNPSNPNEFHSLYSPRDADHACPPASPVVDPASCGAQGILSPTTPPGAPAIPAHCTCKQADSHNQYDTYMPNSHYTCPSPPDCGTQGKPDGTTAFCSCTNTDSKGEHRTYAAGNGAICPTASSAHH